MVYEEWNECRTTAFKGVLSERLACIKVELIFNLVEHFSCSRIFLVVSLHSFAIYHSKMYKELTGHRTTAFKVVLLERPA